MNIQNSVLEMIHIIDQPAEYNSCISGHIEIMQCRAHIYTTWGYKTWESSRRYTISTNNQKERVTCLIPSLQVVKQWFTWLAYLKQEVPDHSTTLWGRRWFHTPGEQLGVHTIPPTRGTVRWRGGRTSSRFGLSGSLCQGSMVCNLI